MWLCEEMEMSQRQELMTGTHNVPLSGERELEPLSQSLKVGGKHLPRRAADVM